MKIKDLDTHRAKFVTPKELAEYIVVKPRTVYAWIEKGALRVTRIEGTVRIPTEVAREFVKY